MAVADIQKPTKTVPAFAAADFEKVERAHGYAAQGAFARLNTVGWSFSSDARRLVGDGWDRVGVAISDCGRFIEVSPSGDDYKWGKEMLTFRPGLQKRTIAQRGVRYAVEMYGGKLYIDLTQTVS